MDLKEYILHAYFFNKYLDVKSDSIRILNRGKYDGFTPGPDFRQGTIEVIKGNTKKVVKGDIELHVHASDWFIHGHQDDSEYNNVILHVVLKDDGKGPNIPTVEINEDELTDFIEDLGKRALHEKPICLPSQKTVRAFQNLLEVNGSKFLSERFDGTLDVVLNNPNWEDDLSQAIYERIMYVLGLDHNQEQMGQIAREIDLNTALSIVKQKGPNGLYDAYINTDGYTKTKNIGQPMNYPGRRLDGMSFILEKISKQGQSLFSLLMNIKKANGIDDLINFFRVKDDRGMEIYVKIRHTNMAQIGEEKAIQIVLQGLKYFDFFHISEEGLNKFIPQSKFQINCERIFGEKVLENVYQNQGMIDIVNNYCTAKPKGCWDCPIQFYCKEFWASEKVVCKSCNLVYYDKDYKYCPNCGKHISDK